MHNTTDWRAWPTEHRDIAAVPTLVEALCRPTHIHYNVCARQMVKVEAEAQL